MKNFAIVTGIDAYANPAWNLTSAVNDALRFTEWALMSGGVATQNLRLLLSPTGQNVTTLPYKEASSSNIIETIQEFQKGMGQGATRLYFYFAGHGVSAPGATRGAEMEPVLIPADVKSFETQYGLLMGFSRIFPVLANVDPKEQFFFIDACRDFQLEDFAPAFSSVGPWSLRREDPGPRSAQYILYATSPGQKAYGKKMSGRGVFAEALLDALEGKGTAKVWSQGKTCYQIQFSSLANYVASRVQQEAKHLRPRDWQRYVQDPQPQSQGGSPDTVLITLAREKVEPVSLRVRIKPSQALKICEVQTLQYLLGRQRDEVVESIGPPAHAVCKFALLPGDYSVLAQAYGYKTKREPCTLYESRVLDWELERGQVRQSEPAARPDQKGSLTVDTSDPNVLIMVWNTERTETFSGFGRVHTGPLTPGIYRAALVMPGEPVDEQTIEVLPGQSECVTLNSPPPQMRPRHLDMLDRLNIDTDDQGYAHLSEYFEGGVARVKLVSLLSFAAFATLWPKGGFHRLRGLGVKPLRGVVPEGGSGLLVLIGVGGDRAAPYVNISRFLGKGSLVVRDREGQVMDQGGFEVLPGFSEAGQRSAQLKPGPLTLELRLPGFAPTCYALTALPNRVTALVTAVEDGGEIAVQQYLLPLRPDDTGYGNVLSAPSSIRRLEMAQRYYTNVKKIPDYDELLELLYGKWLDPLLGCLSGYSLIRFGNQERYEEAAKGNMLRFFNELPDSHILAGLCEPERRNEHYTNALERGLPVFAEGFRVLYLWYKQRDVELPRALVKPGRSLLPGSPWTAWVPSEDVSS